MTHRPQLLPVLLCGSPHDPGVVGMHVQTAFDARFDAHVVGLQRPAERSPDATDCVLPPVHQRAADWWQWLARTSGRG